MASGAETDVRFFDYGSYHSVKEPSIGCRAGATNSPYCSVRRSISVNPIIPDEFCPRLLRRISDVFAFNSEVMEELKCIIRSADLPMHRRLTEFDINDAARARLEDSLIKELIGRQLLNNSEFRSTFFLFPSMTQTRKSETLSRPDFRVIDHSSSLTEKGIHRGMRKFTEDLLHRCRKRRNQVTSSVDDMLQHEHGRESFLGLLRYNPKWAYLLDGLAESVSPEITGEIKELYDNLTMISDSYSAGDQNPQQNTMDSILPVTSEKLKTSNVEALESFHVEVPTTGNGGKLESSESKPAATNERGIGCLQPERVASILQTVRNLVKGALPETQDVPPDGFVPVAPRIESEETIPRAVVLPVPDTTEKENIRNPTVYSVPQTGEKRDLDMRPAVSEPTKNSRPPLLDDDGIDRPISEWVLGIKPQSSNLMDDSGADNTWQKVQRSALLGDGDIIRSADKPMSTATNLVTTIRPRTPLMVEPDIPQKNDIVAVATMIASEPYRSQAFQDVDHRSVCVDVGESRSQFTHLRESKVLAGTAHSQVAASELKELFWLFFKQELVHNPKTLFPDVAGMFASVEPDVTYKSNFSEKDKQWTVNMLFYTDFYSAKDDTEELAAWKLLRKVYPDKKFEEHFDQGLLYRVLPTGAGVKKTAMVKNNFLKVLSTYCHACEIAAKFDLFEFSAVIDSFFAENSDCCSIDTRRIDDGSVSVKIRLSDVVAESTSSDSFSALLSTVKSIYSVQVVDQIFAPVLRYRQNVDPNSAVEALKDSAMSSVFDDHASDSMIPNVSCSAAPTTLLEAPSFDVASTEEGPSTSSIDLYIGHRPTSNSSAPGTDPCHRHVKKPDTELCDAPMELANTPPPSQFDLSHSISVASDRCICLSAILRSIYLNKHTSFCQFIFQSKYFLTALDRIYDDGDALGCLIQLLEFSDMTRQYNFERFWIMTDETIAAACFGRPCAKEPSLWVDFRDRLNQSDFPQSQVEKLICNVGNYKMRMLRKLPCPFPENHMLVFPLLGWLRQGAIGQDLECTLRFSLDEFLSVRL